MTTRYVALLRGINVGGHNIIPMAALAQAITRAGYANVSTYIASGNVLLDAPEPPRALETRLERVLGKAFAYDATVVVRSRDDIAAMIAALPAGWRTPRADTRYNVLFLRHTIDDAAIVERLGARRGVEAIAYHPGTIFWAAKIAQLGHSGVAKLAQSAALYPHITVRNLNTTTKLAALVAHTK